MPPWNVAMRGSASRPGVERGAELLLEVALRVGVLGEDQHALVRVRLAPSRRGASPARRPGRAPPRRPRSSARAGRARCAKASAGAPARHRARRRRLHRRVLLCARRRLRVASARSSSASGRCRAGCAERRDGRSRSAAAAAPPSPPAPRTPCGGPAACDANASIDESSRFCRLQSTSAAAVLHRLRRVLQPLLARLRGTRRAAAAAAAPASSAGSPSIGTSTICRSGKPPSSPRRSSLSRRTITGSSCFAPSTGTPRQKRCGSRISSSAEKLFEWPLCGVADRNSRCSNRGASSRIDFVNCESMA